MAGFNISTTHLNSKRGVQIYPLLEQIQQQKEKESQKQKEKITTENRRNEVFSRVKQDCKNIPFWIPEPVKFKNYDVDKEINDFNECKSLDTTLNLIKQKKIKHYQEYSKDYTYHKELHDETLSKTFQEYNDGVLPNNNDVNFVKPHCCFNHYFGLTAKRGMTQLLPIFDYELHLIHLMNTRNLITYFASRGLGKTHIIVVRYANWRILKSHEWDNTDILLTTGLTQANSTELLNKIENMWEQAFPNFPLDYKGGNEMYIDKTRLIAFPAENLKKMRLYDKVSAIFVDEADFFSLRDQERLQEVVFGYIIKSNPLILFFSTPDKPMGFLMKCRKKWLTQKEENKNKQLLN